MRRRSGLRTGSLSGLALNVLYVPVGENRPWFGLLVPVALVLFGAWWPGLGYPGVSYPPKRVRVEESYPKPRRPPRCSSAANP
jgi:hypothetical protein